MKRYQLRIGGQSVDPQGARWFDTQNPYTGQAWAEIPRGDARDVDAAVKAAHAALTTGPWSETSATQRGALIVNPRSSIWKPMVLRALRFREYSITLGLVPW